MGTYHRANAYTERLHRRSKPPRANIKPAGAPKLRKNHQKKLDEHIQKWIGNQERIQQHEQPSPAMAIEPTITPQLAWDGNHHCISPPKREEIIGNIRKAVLPRKPKSKTKFRSKREPPTNRRNLSSCKPNQPQIDQTAAQDQR